MKADRTAKQDGTAESVSLKALRRPEELRRSLIQLQERHSVCWERCISLARRDEGEHVSASRNIRRQEDSFAEAAALEAEIQETREALSDAVNAAEKLLNRLEAAPDIHSYPNALVLRLRYLENLTWAEVCAALRRNGFPVTIRNVSSWRDAALKELDRIVEPPDVEKH